MAGELLEFVGIGGKVVYGLAQNLEEDEVGAVLLGDVTAIRENDQVRTTGKIMEVPSGGACSARYVGPSASPIDGKPRRKAEGTRPVEFKAPGVISRKPVHEPMQTGIIAVDAMVPIGRGQRELIIGDRQTGKTAIAIDAIINQKDTDIICIYVAVVNEKGFHGCRRYGDAREAWRHGQDHHCRGERFRLCSASVHRSYGRCCNGRVLRLYRRER